MSPLGHGGVRLEEFDAPYSHRGGDALTEGLPSAAHNLQCLLREWVFQGVDVEDFFIMRVALGAQDRGNLLARYDCAQKLNSLSIESVCALIVHDAWQAQVLARLGERMDQVLCNLL